jgi:hypothetical protein
VPEVGLEPTRPNGQEILSLSCIPISPLGQVSTIYLTRFSTNRQFFGDSFHLRLFQLQRRGLGEYEV